MKKITSFTILVIIELLCFVNATFASGANAVFYSIGQIIGILIIPAIIIFIIVKVSKKSKKNEKM